MKREFYVFVERDESGLYVGEVPQLRACYAQGHSLDELMQRIREVIELCLEEDPASLEGIGEFVAVQRVAVG